jgi:uncharacterized protein YcsI (UPF0317 family)
MVLARARPEEARRLMRFRELSGVTSGLCLGYLQADLAILPAEAAGEFRDFCLANPRPLSLIDVTEPDDPMPRGVAPGADLHTNLPRYASTTESGTNRGRRSAVGQVYACG